MTSAGTAGQINPFGIDRNGIFHIGDGIFEIGNDHFGAASCGGPIGSAEFREDHVPVFDPGQFGITDIGVLPMIITPGMEADDQRTGFRTGSGGKFGFLHGTVDFARIKNVLYCGHKRSPLFLSIIYNGNRKNQYRWG